MRKYLGLWYGGSSYAVPDPSVASHREYFGSIRAAGQTLAARADQEPGFPCVEQEQCEMHLYQGGEYHENGPDVVLTLGPRGGVRRS